MVTSPMNTTPANTLSRLYRVFIREDGGVTVQCNEVYLPFSDPSVIYRVAEMPPVIQAAYLILTREGVPDAVYLASKFAVEALSDVRECVECYIPSKVVSVWLRDQNKTYPVE